MLKLCWLAAGLVLGEEYSDYPDYAADYAYEGSPQGTTTGARGVTTIANRVTTTTTGSTTTTDVPPRTMLDDFVAIPEEEPEEIEDDLGRMNMNQFQWPVGKNEGAETETYVNPVNRLEGELLATGNFRLVWEYDATHSGFTFEYQTIVGNYEASTEYESFSEGNVQVTTETIENVDYYVATLVPTATNTVYRIRVVALDNEDPANESPEQTIDMQSSTVELTHQPGTIYTGNSGFAGQVLLVNDFTHESYVPTDAADNVGYVTAVKVTFPAGCTYPTFRIDADLDQSYIYTDDSISTPHRIFVFPQTHFSNALGGPIKAFHYYVSNMYGCVTDPENDVQVETVNSYITRTADAVDGTTSPSNVTVTAMWPSDGSYPPVQFTEQHVVWFDTLIQQKTHLGPSTALSAPRVTFTTGTCDVYVNIAEETDESGAGFSVGWGYQNTYDSNLAMTDLFSNPGTTNVGTSFVFQALEWLNHIGVTFRFSTADENCLTIASAGTITFLALDTDTYSLTRVPDQNEINAMNNGK